MLQKPTLSIIVPVYNTEGYLQRCIESIISQSFNDWELILIDDGSTDNSPHICDEYAVQNDKISVYHQENKGVSSARNFGIKESHGKWCLFVDSDDYLIEDSLANISEALMDNIDAIQFNVQHESGAKDQCPTIDRETDISASGYINHHFHPALWHHIFKKDIIEKYNLALDESLTFSEDIVFIVEYMIFAKTIKLIPINVYLFSYREESVTHDPNKYEINVKCQLKAALSLIHFAYNNKIKYYRISRFVTQFIIYHLYQINLFFLDKTTNKKTFRETLKEMRKFKYNTLAFRLLCLIYTTAVNKANYLYSVDYYLFKRLRKLHFVI